jgi:hypothetical protein
LIATASFENNFAIWDLKSEEDILERRILINKFQLRFFAAFIERERKAHLEIRF